VTVPVSPDHHNLGWTLGFIFFGVTVAAVVALVVPILLLANKIGKQAPGINSSLTESLDNTAGLAGLETTIDHATEIISGLYRARVRLGG
jgi:ABC-type Na+ efflux pump permease subunit